MNDATCLKAHRIATGLGVKQGAWTPDRPDQRRPLDMFVTAGQVSDAFGARALTGSLPDVDGLLGDRGHDANGFREAVQYRGIPPGTLGRKRRRTSVKYDKRR